MGFRMIVLGLLTPWIAYAGITILHLILPAFRLKGYVNHEKTGEPLSYRINGVFVLAASVLLWYLLGRFDIVPHTWLYNVRWASLAGAAVMGLLFSFLIVCTQSSTGKPFLADFWFGRIWNPQIKNGLLDVKMWLYMIGAVMLQLNVLSFAAHHMQTFGSNFNPCIVLCVSMTTWFCWDYLFFERVHLYTYDIFAERVGFKLGFGCLAFYPFFYSFPLWFTANLPNPGRSDWMIPVLGLMFLFGWVFTRGANMQKYYFKRNPEKKFLWMEPTTITDGTHSLLVSGYWSKSRHINYMGEIIQAFAVALASGHPAVWVVWLYPAYYIALMFTRQADDDVICKAKYSDLWDLYKEKVKYRIIPYIY